jgi:hypothetical protein
VLGDVTSDPIIQWLTQGGSVGILAAAVVSFQRGWIVPGSAYRQVREDRDKALELVYKQAEIAQRAVEAAERRLTQ